MGKLGKALKGELEAHEKEAAEWTESPEKIIGKYEKVLNEQEWTISSPAGSSEVEMRTQRGDLEIRVKFDSELVAQSMNSNDALEEEEYDEEEEGKVRSEEEYDEDGDFEEDEDFGPQPFNFTVELRRPSLPGKFIEMELEAVPGPSPSSDELYVNSVFVRSEEKIPESAPSRYVGPQFETLDEEVRSAFDGFASKNLRHLVPFIGEYSQSLESIDYGKWVQDLKTFTN